MRVGNHGWQLMVDSLPANADPLVFCTYGPAKVAESCREGSATPFSGCVVDQWPIIGRVWRNRRETFNLSSMTSPTLTSPGGSCPEEVVATAAQSTCDSCAVAARVPAPSHAAELSGALAPCALGRHNRFGCRRRTP